jgi:hypothetical protein
LFINQNGKQHMKQRFLPSVFAFFLVLGLSTRAHANFAIYESYVILGGTYYDLFATTGNPDFSGANLGSFTTGATLTFTGGQIKTFKESRNSCNSNVCGGNIYWTVKLSGATQNNGSEVLGYNSGFGNQNSGACSVNQQWDQTVGTTNLLSGLGAGAYTLEVFCTATGSSTSNSLCDEIPAQSTLTATFTVNIPLSATLLSFSTEKISNNIALNWATATEVNNDFFEIEHHIADQDWFVLGRVGAKGTGTNDQVYQFIQHKPAKGLHYYRLKQVDLDGKATFSPIVSVDFQSNTQIVLSPNPLRGDQLSIQLPDAETAHQLRLFNLQGQLLKSWSIEAGAATWQNLDVGGVASGLLFLQMDGGVPLQLIRE